jgi:hypothetical protein
MLRFHGFGGKVETFSATRHALVLNAPVSVYEFTVAGSQVVLGDARFCRGAQKRTCR